MQVSLHAILSQVKYLHDLHPSVLPERLHQPRSTQLRPQTLLQLQDLRDVVLQTRRHQPLIVSDVKLKHTRDVLTFDLRSNALATMLRLCTSVVFPPSGRSSGGQH